MLSTSRCNLTAVRADDLDPLIRLNADPEVRCYLGGPVAESAIRTRFPMLLAGETTDQYWAIRTKADDSFIGIITLGPHHDGIDTEVSYLMLPEWWGQGYATEAVNAIIQHGLTTLGYPRIIAETQSANLSSCRLLERLGMSFERTVERFGAEQSIYATQLM